MLTDIFPPNHDQGMNDSAEVNPTASVEEDSSMEDDDDLEILSSPEKTPVESVVIDDDDADEDEKSESNAGDNMDTVKDKFESIEELDKEASVNREPADSIGGKDDVSSNSSASAKQESVFNSDNSRDSHIIDKKVRKLSADDERMSNSSNISSEHFKQDVNSDDNIDMEESNVVSNSIDNNRVKADSSSDSKSDIKCDGNDQRDLVLTMKMKIQPPSVAGDDEASNSSVGSDRKRPALDDGEMGGSTKRSRLDDMIGKLGSHIGIEPEELTVEDQDMEESDTSDVKSEASSSVDEDDKTSSDSSTKAVQLTEKVTYTK